MIKILKILDKNYNTLAYLNHIQDDILIREIINGEYTLSFKGNVEELKTVYLYDENNVLEIDNDYFRPVKIVDERTSNGMTYISCQAEHISYDLLNTKFDDFKYIYKDINNNQVITRVTLDDSVDAEELWVVQAKKDLLHYVWLKVSYKGIQGFFYYSGAYYSDYYKKYIDGYSDPYQNNRWEILEKINTGSKEWTVRKMYQTLSVFSEIEVRDKPGLTGTAVIAKIPTSFQNGNGQGTIIVEAITEEYEDSYRNRWIRTTVGGKTGWVSGRYLSAERGGPTYYIPEDWISFNTGDAP